MSSEREPTEAYVWAWLPGALDPVVAGRLELIAGRVYFNYGRSYLGRSEAIALYLPELPLTPGRLTPAAGLHVAGVFADAGPDAWGQRLILHRHLGYAGTSVDPAELSVLTYLLESGSDRIGALDFQESADQYVPRSGGGTLEEMMEAAERLEAGEPFSPAVDDALVDGSSLGGARPKVSLTDRRGHKQIAKFSSRTDTYPVVKAEGVAMDLARRVGLNVPNTKVIDCLGRDVLLVDRFDRTVTAGERRMVVSALTILELDEMRGRYASYWKLAEAILERFSHPDKTLRELFSRIVFNICVGNTDDHARNHAAFWDGVSLSLTPAYDICPQMRSGDTARQAMDIGKDGFRDSQLAGCLDHARAYHLSRAEARDIIDSQVTLINEQWADATEDARLTQADRQLLWGSLIMRPSIFYGY